MGEVKPRIIGGANRRRVTGLPIGRVGDRPAAAGAETGVARDTFTAALVCGVTVVTALGRDRYGFVFAGVAQPLLHVDFARDISSSMHPRLRLIDDSKTLGSMFSESDSSGDGARLFRLRVGFDTMAVEISRARNVGGLISGTYHFVYSSGSVDCVA